MEFSDNYRFMHLIIEIEIQKIINRASLFLKLNSISIKKFR